MEPGFALFPANFLAAGITQSDLLAIISWPVCYGDASTHWGKEGLTQGPGCCLWVWAGAGKAASNSALTLLWSLHWSLDLSKVENLRLLWTKSWVHKWKYLERVNNSHNQEHLPGSRKDVHGKQVSEQWLCLLEVAPSRLGGLLWKYWN